MQKKKSLDGGKLEEHKDNSGRKRELKSGCAWPRRVAMSINIDFNLYMHLCNTRET